LLFFQQGSNARMTTTKSYDLIGEVANGSLVRSYVWGNDLSGSQQGAGGVGGLLEVSYYGAQTTNCFAAYDGNGNLSGLVNAADGTVAARYEYGPFGEPIRLTGAMGKANPFQFSTKYQDDETDLLYYGYRYYSPNTGRWSNRDPLNVVAGEEDRFELIKNYGFDDDFAQSIEAISADLNDYIFAHNRPIIDYDVLGMFSVLGTILGICESTSSGPGVFIPGHFGHHWLGRPGHRLALKVCCPLCKPFLPTYGITANPVPKSFHVGWPAWLFPQRVFPTDWTTITITTSVSIFDGRCYTIVINVPTRTVRVDKASIANVRAIGLCCMIPIGPFRSDRSVPPDWYTPPPSPTIIFY
jgi:RHS repeat-associated protein